MGVRPTSPLNLFETLHRKAEACRGSCQPHRLDLTSQLCCSQHCMGSWRKGPLQRTQLWSTQKAWNSPEAFHSDFSTSSYRAQNWPLAVRKGKIFISDDLLLWQCHEGFHWQKHLLSATTFALLGHKPAWFWGCIMLPRTIFILTLLKMAILILLPTKMTWYFIYKIPKDLYNILIKALRCGEGTTHASNMLTSPHQDSCNENRAEN